MASAAADGVQESEEVSRARACIDDEVDEQLSAPLVAMSHHVTVSSGDTLTSIPNSESAGITESSSTAAVSLGKRPRGLSDTSDSQDVPSVPKPRLTIKIRPSAARIASKMSTAGVKDQNLEKWFNAVQLILSVLVSL